MQPNFADLRDWLLSRMAEDQRLRSGPVDAAAWLTFDTESTRVLREAVAREGWPGRSRVGEDGATAAFLLAQHSPDLAFQKQVLALLHAQPPGEVDLAYAAYLHDRICIREGRPQRYGTQVQADGHPFPLEPGDVDARRAEVGLGPLENYLRQFRR